MAELLIVDDEKAARFGMKKALNRNNYHIQEAENGIQALETLKNSQIDLMFLDLNMPEMGGMEVLQKIIELSNPPLVIVVTAYGSEKIAVEAMKLGAYDYISKPYELDELRLMTERAIEKVMLQRENKRLQEEIQLQQSFGEIIGQSQVMQPVYNLIDVAAQTNITVLICGESGTGKELVAREIHKRSSRSQKPFIATNCAAIPENLIESELFGHEKGAFTGAGEARKGKLEDAHEGTLFLDEIGDMSASTQAKILRVLQDCTFQKIGGNKNIQVDVRFIAATNKDLSQEIEEGNFREDLYYRINVLDISLPPLRKRGNDISLLAERFVDFFSRKYHKQNISIHPETMKALMNYSWPGNVRQLKNIIEKSVLLCLEQSLSLKDLPCEIIQEPSKKETISSAEIPISNFISNDISFKEAKRNYVREFEKQFIIQRLKIYQGNISQTANSLEIPRQSLQQKLKELDIHVRELMASEAKSETKI